MTVSMMVTFRCKLEYLHSALAEDDPMNAAQQASRLVKELKPRGKTSSPKSNRLLRLSSAWRINRLAFLLSGFFDFTSVQFPTESRNWTEAVGVQHGMLVGYPSHDNWATSPGTLGVLVEEEIPIYVPFFFTCEKSAKRKLYRWPPRSFRYCLR